MLKFNLYNITDTETGLKVKVSYSDSINKEGIKTVTIYEDGYTSNLFKLFDNARNYSESMTDYYESTRVRIREGELYFDEALKMCERLRVKHAVAREKQEAKCRAYWESKKTA